MLAVRDQATCGCADAQPQISMWRVQGCRPRQELGRRLPLTIKAFCQWIRYHKPAARQLWWGKASLGGASSVKLSLGTALRTAASKLSRGPYLLRLSASTTNHSEEVGAAGATVAAVVNQ